eukprot:scaffold37528_cov17-Tisochrysis_lutea.AAC.2
MSSAAPFLFCCHACVGGRLECAIRHENAAPAPSTGVISSQRSMRAPHACSTVCYSLQEAAMTDELEEACAMLVECIDLRKKWLFQVLSYGAGATAAGAICPSCVGEARVQYQWQVEGTGCPMLLGQ